MKLHLLLPHLRQAVEDPIEFESQLVGVLYVSISSSSTGNQAEVEVDKDRAQVTLSFKSSFISTPIHIPSQTNVALLRWQKFN